MTAFPLVAADFAVRHGLTFTESAVLLLRFRSAAEAVLTYARAADLDPSTFPDPPRAAIGAGTEVRS